MAEYAVFVNSVETPVLMDSLNWQTVANGIGTLQCAIDSDDGSYRPEVDDEVVLKRDGAPIWGGYASTCPEEEFGGVAQDGIKTTLTAASFEVVLTYRFVTLTIADGTTLEAALNSLASYLPTGFAIHPSQATGPALPEITFTRVRLDKVLSRLFEFTSYLFKVTPTKYLLMYDPLTVPAPFDLLDTGPVYQIGDVRVDRTLNEFYANRSLVTVTTGPATSAETFVAADGASSGGFTRFTAKYPASQSINDTYPNLLTFDGVVASVIGFNSDQLGPDDWYWDTTVSPAQLVYPEAGGRPFPTGAQVIDIAYAIRYPFQVTGNNLVEQGLRGIREREYQVEEMPLATAQDYADAVVANTARIIVKPSYSTHTDGLEPGMIQPIDIAKRDLDGDFLILDVRASMPPGSDQTYLRYDVTAVEGVNVESDWRKVYKDWLGEKSGSGGGGSVSTGTSGACVGVFVDVPFDAGNFTANNGGTWTLVSGDQVKFYYLRMGPKIVRFYFHIDTSSVTAGGSPAPTQLRIAIPFQSFTTTAPHPVTFVDNGTAIPGVSVKANAGDQYLTISGWDSSSFSDSTNESYVMGSLDIWAEPAPQTIPAGTLVFSDVGLSQLIFMHPTTGAFYTPPSSNPHAGDGNLGIVALTPGGKVAAIGGYTNAAPDVPAASLPPPATVFVWDTDFASVFGVTASNGASRGIARDDSSRFYGFHHPSGNFRRFDEDGTTLASFAIDLHTASLTEAFGVSPDGSIAYYAAGAGTYPQTVYSWDLTGDTDLGSFASFGSSYEVRARAVVVLANDNIVIGWSKAASDAKVVCYDPGGSVVWTQTLSGTTPFTMTPGSDGTYFFMAYGHTSAANASGIRVARFLGSDGSIVGSYVEPVGSFEFSGPFCETLVDI